VTVRRATPGDAAAVAALAELDGREPLRGDVLVAEADGELRAALSLVDGRTIADPFRPTAVARELLRLRAARLGLAGREPRKRASPLRRLVARTRLDVQPGGR
jgi:hypothetical protein